MASWLYHYSSELMVEKQLLTEANVTNITKEVYALFGNKFMVVYSYFLGHRGQFLVEFPLKLQRMMKIR